MADQIVLNTMPRKERGTRAATKLRAKECGELEASKVAAYGKLGRLPVSLSQAFVADLTRDRVKEFPGFDRGEFKKLTEDELKMMDDQMFGVCCIDATIDISSPSRYEHAHYRYPGWWDASFERPDRADTLGRETVGAKR